MSVPSFVLEKLQTYINDVTKGFQELIDRIVGAETDNENVPFFITDTLYCTSMIYTYQDEALATGNAAFMFYAMDISVHDNILTSSVEPFGRCDFDTRWSSMTEEQRTATENSLNAYVPEHLTAEQTHEGDLRVTYYTTTADVSVEYGEPPVQHTSDVYRQMVRANSQIVKNDRLTIRFNDVDYSVDANGYISIVPSSNLWNLYISEQTCRCIKGYPVILKSSNTSFINTFISDNGATNNYTGTYTTPDNETIDYYYGDNYIIINPSGDVSYDDVKHVLDVSVTKINEDNDGDIKVPTYRENKYGPEPPEPTDDDDIDEQDMGVGTNLGGLGGYWLLTKEQLADLHGALDSAPVGFDPLNSFISLMGLGVDASKVLDATQFQYVTPINIRMSDGTTWQTGVEAHIISSNEIVSAFNSDTFRIQRKFNNFLDYSPYATHELFIPMCGWVTLPDIAVDRDIYVTYIPDIESCKCRAVVSVVSNSVGDNDACVIAEKDGIMGSDVPFSNVGHSLFVGDAIINGANVAGEVITGAIGAGFTKTNAKGGTYRPYEGFTVGMGGTLPGAIGNAFISGNINRTHFMTGNSTKIGFSDGESIIVKSVYHLPDMPENYAHTVGLVCNKTGQLSEFNGFTVCDNPHITFSALEAEKEEIKRLLEEGVILPSGE